MKKKWWKPAGRPVTTERADPAAPLLCTVNRGTAGVGLIKKERKVKPVRNYQWVPKGSYKVPKTHANLKGPKKTWVPKTLT